jgi:hypothetical protein
MPFIKATETSGELARVCPMEDNGEGLLLPHGTRFLDLLEEAPELPTEKKVEDK